MRRMVKREEPQRLMGKKTRAMRRTLMRRRSKRLRHRKWRRYHLWNRLMVTNKWKRQIPKK